MSIEAHRWVMTAVKAPLERAAFHGRRPGPGEVVVDDRRLRRLPHRPRLLYDGVRTNHPLPLALGHEISGRVVAAGAGAESWMRQGGDRPGGAAVRANATSASAVSRTICRAQKMPGNDIHGGFASHIVVPGRGLCEVDEARLASGGSRRSPTSRSSPTR